VLSAFGSVPPNDGRSETPITPCGSAGDGSFLVNQSIRLSSRGRARLGAATLSAFTLLLMSSGAAQAAATPVPLGDAWTFAVLAATGVTNSGGSTINGDLGSFPTVSIDGGITINGTNHAGDLVTQAAKISLDAAVTSANGEGPVDGTISADLGGQTLTPGVYFQGGTMLLDGGVLTLNAGGDPNAVWVFKGGADLSVNVGSSVELAGGAQACNVYWVMNSKAAIGGSSRFIGTIMAGTSVTFGTNASLVGRALAQTGNVTLLANTITRPSCAAAGTGTGTGSSSGRAAGPRTGDGSTSQANGSHGAYLAVAVVGLGALATAVVVTRRRRNESA
jgi:hypothetical protein